MRAFSLLLAILVISNCQQEDFFPLPCPEDQINQSFVLDYTPRFWTSDRDAWQFWGFVSDSEGQPRETIRFGEGISNRLYLEEYCNSGMDFTFCEVRRQNENEYYVSLRTITQVNAGHQLTEPYSWGARIHALDGPRIVDLPSDVEEITVVSRNNQYSVDHNEAERTALIHLDNLWAKKDCLLR